MNAPMKIVIGNAELWLFEDAQREQDKFGHESRDANSATRQTADLFSEPAA